MKNRFVRSRVDLRAACVLLERFERNRRRARNERRRASFRPNFDGGGQTDLNATRRRRRFFAVVHRDDVVEPACFRIRMHDGKRFIGRIYNKRRRLRQVVRAASRQRENERISRRSRRGFHARAIGRRDVERPSVVVGVRRGRDRTRADVIKMRRIHDDFERRRFGRLPRRVVVGPQLDGRGRLSGWNLNEPGTFIRHANLV